MFYKCRYSAEPISPFGSMIGTIADESTGCPLIVGSAVI